MIAWAAGQGAMQNLLTALQFLPEAAKGSVIPITAARDRRTRGGSRRTTDRGKRLAVRVIWRTDEIGESADFGSFP